MQSIQVDFDPATETVSSIEGAAAEPWEAVCERYDNDVHRIMDIVDETAYTALYACYDEDNRAVYFLVEEGEALTKLRRKTFLSKLGRPPA